MIITLGVDTRNNGISMIEDILKLLPQANCSVMEITDRTRFVTINISEKVRYTPEQQLFIKSLQLLQKRNL